MNTVSKEWLTRDQIESKYTPRFESIESKDRSGKDTTVYALISRNEKGDVLYVVPGNTIELPRTNK